MSDDEIEELLKSLIQTGHAVRDESERPPSLEMAARAERLGSLFTAQAAALRAALRP